MKGYNKRTLRVTVGNRLYVKIISVSVVNGFTGDTFLDILSHIIQHTFDYGNQSYMQMITTCSNSLFVFDRQVFATLRFTCLFLGIWTLVHHKEGHKGYRATKSTEAGGWHG